MKSKGLLIVISGPSGAGKGSICRELLHNCGNNLELSISATTREPRDGEHEGVDYFFKSEKEFAVMAKNGEFLEYTEVHGNYYGTPRKYVMDRLEEGKHVILEIDVQGGMKIKDVFAEAIFIFVMPPTFEELRRRIKGRGTETEQDISKRMRNAHSEIKYASCYDYIVVNDYIRSATEKISCILTAENCRYKRCNIDFENFREG